MKTIRLAGIFMIVSSFIMAGDIFAHDPMSDAFVLYPPFDQGDPVVEPFAEYGGKAVGYPVGSCTL